MEEEISADGMRDVTSLLEAFSPTIAFRHQGFSDCLDAVAVRWAVVNVMNANERAPST